MSSKNTMTVKQKDEKLIALAKTLKNVPMCEDYELMICGLNYHDFAQELVEARFRARKWITKYSTYCPGDDVTAKEFDEIRYNMLDQIIGKMGKNTYIEAPFTFDYGTNIILGDNFYANFGTCILDCALVIIGDRVLFGPNVSLFTATHDTEVQTRRDHLERAHTITIGDDCWIGGDCTILPGVNIGKGCTIGAGSVVTKSIPDYSVAVGNPARVIKTVEPCQDLKKDAE
ncbi:putative maltose O-acetyltransferase [Dipodascopsis uninucleata]